MPTYCTRRTEEARSLTTRVSTQPGGRLTRAPHAAAHLVHPDKARQRVHLDLEADRERFAHIILGLQARNTNDVVRLYQSALGVPDASSRGAARAVPSRRRR